MKYRNNPSILPVSIIALLFATLSAFCSNIISARNSSAESKKSEHSLTYVPLYSQIYFGDSLRPFNLAATVSIRNLSTEQDLKVLKAQYVNAAGVKIRDLINEPITLKPLATHSIKIDQSDIEGGLSASVLIHWTSEKNIPAPLVESIMIGTSSGQGISFSSRGLQINPSE